MVGGVVTVTYHDERVEDWEADPAFPLADFFNWFRLDCTCGGCGREWELTTIDTKWKLTRHAEPGSVLSSGDS